jgi:hypothetical protein
VTGVAANAGWHWHQGSALLTHRDQRRRCPARAAGDLYAYWQRCWVVAVAVQFHHAGNEVLDGAALPAGGVDCATVCRPVAHPEWADLRPINHAANKRSESADSALGETLTVLPASLNVIRPDPPSISKSKRANRRYAPSSNTGLHRCPGQVRMRWHRSTDGIRGRLPLPRVKEGHIPAYRATRSLLERPHFGADVHGTDMGLRGGLGPCGTGDETVPLALGVDHERGVGDRLRLIWPLSLNRTPHAFSTLDVQVPRRPQTLTNDMSWYTIVPP